jgi:hypothetical protein
MGIVRKINRFVDMLQDHVLHVVPVVSMGYYILEVPVSNRVFGSILWYFSAFPRQVR